MNRNEFLNTLFAMYPKSFTEENKQIWLDAYIKVLEQNIDFDDLYNTMIYEWENKTAPSPKWLTTKKKYKQGHDKVENLSIENISATSQSGKTYIFAYNTKESNYSLEVEKLHKMGFKDISKEREV